MDPAWKHKGEFVFQFLKQETCILSKKYFFLSC